MKHPPTDQLRKKVVVRGGRAASGQIFTDDVNGFFREGGWPETLQFDVSYDTPSVKSVRKIPLAVGPWLKTVNMQYRYLWEASTFNL